MKKWKLIKETDVSPSKWLPVMQHTVELPNGKIIDDYFVAPLGMVAMILPITKENKIVFVKQYKHGIDEIMIELPAGFQQKGKTLEETAVAELEEEVGIKTTIDNLEFLGKVAMNPTKSDHTTYCYLAKDLEFNSSQNLEETEDIEIIQVTPLEALEMINKGEIWSSDTTAYILKAYFKYPELFK